MINYLNKENIYPTNKEANIMYNMIKNNTDYVLQNPVVALNSINVSKDTYIKLINLYDKNKKYYS